MNDVEKLTLIIKAVRFTSLEDQLGWDPNFKSLVTEDTEDELLNYLKNLRDRAVRIEQASK